MRISNALLATIVALCCAACSVGPHYKRPDMALPAQFVAPGTSRATTGSPQVEAADPQFWHSFHDPELTTLVERALTSNNDLRSALAHYDAADALWRLSKFDRYPTVTASEDVGREKLAASQAFGYPRNYRYSNSTLNASWELDFFGRVRHNIESQHQQLLATANDQAAMQVAIVGEVAATYIDLRGQQERLRVARQNAENEGRTVKLVEATYSAGRGTQFDTARARAQYESTNSRIPALLSAIALDEHRLAVLCGQSPDTLVAELDAQKPLPDLPEGIDPGTPAELVRRRPDINASEQRLHAATEEIGIQTADLFPRLNFAGLLGIAEYHSDSPFDGFSPVNMAALNIDWSFLDRGRVKARIAASQADGDAQLAQYQQTVLLALEDVDNALVRYARSREQDAQLSQAAADSKRAADLADIRFREGATGLLDLLDAQREELEAEDAYATSHLNSASAAVSLYKSLAGGWPQLQPAKIARP
ncbi:efflux transporter outer membrane subunit [Silvibacterium dinghuense]|uniref:Efflux transporter outer membrane subunit n=1 Tax=Silvibacterium dinghuense TaxID=1560006 RepID=A0A4Q1S9E2_9BACT|nr:efflux transporter outer membrane subunit [Silvibacterium dinghuense]RXS93673.1 efflux transporter outer membrane subunit [Silvibacterium dinghuense]GGH06673.1 multidrug efflux outer membrane protein OprN [Silvibacterium dinghuense]